MRFGGPETGMATESASPLTDRTEYCETCGRETQHSVHVEIRTESENADNAGFSREPYRVAECLVCDTERVQRMNNA